MLNRGLFYKHLAGLIILSTLGHARVFWTIMTPMPTARSHFGVGMVSGYIYCFGGSQNWDGNYITRVNERYSPATNSWATMAPMLYPRKAFASATLNGLIYAIGGIDSTLSSLPPSDRNERYNPSTNSWTSLAPLPLPVYGCAGTACGNYVYVIGGRYGGVSGGYNEVACQRYDPSTNTWAQMAPLPESLRYCGAVSYGGRIYVIGGTDRLGLRCNKVYEYNPATNIWTLVNSAMITARSTLMPDSVTASGRSFIFTAGGAGPGTPQEVNVAEFYNTPPTNTWISETPMNYARFALGFARVDSFVYAIGGTYDIGAIPYNYNERGHYVYVNVIVDPDQSDSTDPGVPKYYRLQVTNNGWRTDTIDITTSGTISTWTVARLRADSVTPLPDTDGDGIPDTGPLARGQSTYIVIRLTPPSNAPAGQIDLTTVTGRSSVDVNIFDIALLTTRVKLLASILVDPNQSDSLFPGDSVRYPLTVTNNGNIIDTISLVTVRTLPNWTARLVDSSGLVISRIAVNPFGARRGFFCWIKAPTNALGGTTDLTTVRGTSCWRTTVQDSAILSTRVKVRASILVDPDQSGTIASGDSIRYPVDVINNGNANDTVSFVTNGTISGWSARVCDSNGVTISRIAVAALGGRRGIFTWIKSPSNAPAGRTDTTRLVGTSRWSAAVRDSAILRTTIRLTASIIVDPDRQGTVRPRDSTEYSLYVVNNGNATDSILLTTGRTRPWARAIIYDSLHRVISYVKLAPFGGRQNIILQIKADSTAIAGWTDTTILRGQSTNIPTTRDSAIVRTTVIPVTNIIVDPDRQGFVSRFDSIWYNHYIENRGNTRDSIPLFTRGTRPTWRAQIWDSARTQIINNVVLNPGQRKTVYLKIKPDTNSQYRNADTTYLVGYSTSGTARDSARDITEITLDARILVDPDQQNSILPGDSIYYYLYVKNQGNARDTILLSNDAPPPGWTVTIQDSIGNTINRVVLGPIRDSIRIRAKIKSPSNAPMGFADTTFVKGVSRNISTVSDSARLITIIMPLARIIVDPDSQASAAPAETVRYYLNVINQGNATDSILLTRTDTRPSWHSFICDSTGTTQIGYVKLPPQGGRIKIMTKVVSPDTAQAGAVNTTQVIGTSTVVPTVRDTARLTTTIRTTARIIVDPNQASNTIPRQTVRYYLDVINQGNNTDSILLSTANTRPFWNALIYDSAGTNQLTFVKLPGLGGRTKIRVDITPPDTAQAPAGIKDTTYVIGTSTNIPGIKDSARLITTIDFVAGLIIRPDQSGRTLPGRSIDYFLRSINRGNGPDSVNLTRYRTRSGWTAQLLDSTGTNPITRINLGPYNDSVKFILRITPPINVPPTEVDTTIVRGTSITNSSIYDTAIVNTYIGVQANIIVDPDQQANSMPGDTVRYFVNVINDGNATDSITLRTSHTSVGWYAGIFDSTGTIPRTYVRLPPFGGRATIMIKIRSPNNAPQGMSDTTFIHGHSTNDSTVTDSARLITTITGFARIIVDPDRIGRTNPGVTITYLHSVTNLGTMRDSINLLSRGTRSTWLRQIRDSAGINPVSFVVLNPGEARWLTLLITPPNNAGTTDVDTSYLIGVSSINNTVRDSAQDITQINRLISGLNIESNQQATIPSRQTKVYNLTAVLIGNAPDTVELKTKNTRTGWTATLCQKDGTTPLGSKVVVDPSVPFEFTLKVTAPEVSIIGSQAMDTTSNKDSTTVLGNVLFLPNLADSVSLITTVIPGLDIHNFASPFKLQKGTKFIFSVPEAGKVDLVIYNRLGEEIVRVLENRGVNPGIHITPWNGKNTNGKTVSPGVYIYIFKFRSDVTKEETVIKKKTAVTQ